MPRSLVLALALLLAACDLGGSPSDDLIGTWRNSTTVRAELVTSRTAQRVPDLTAAALQGLTVTGADQATLRYLAFETASNPGEVLLLGTPYPRDCGSTCARLSANPFGPSPWFFAYVGLGAYTGETADAGAFRFTDSGFSLRPTTLRSESGDEVVVGGDMVFPTVALPAGRPTPVPSGSAQSVEADPVAITFGPDGAFRIESVFPDGGRWTQSAGTWRDVGDGRLEIDFGTFVVQGGDPGQAVPQVFDATYVVADGALTFYLARALEPTTDADLLRAAEGRLHAAPGSIVETLPGTLYTFDIVVP